MGKILVIAEKPSVAADYAKALNQFKKEDGYYEGDKYVITWAIGHIISRKELYEYDGNINRAAQNREHVLATLPYFPEKHVLKLALGNLERCKNDKGRLAMVTRNNEGLLKRQEAIKKLFARTDIDFVVNGCDAGREGEAIFHQIYDYFNCTFPVKRLWLSSNVAKDIVSEFGNLRPGSNYENLKKASYARAEMDWEHGLNLSALYASLYGAQLSIGRVQTPVVNMIVERENEIRNFKSEDYYTLDAQFSTTDNFKYKSRLVIDESLGNIVTDGKIKDISKINEIIASVENSQGAVQSIETTHKKESPKLLYSLSDLQKEMDTKHKMTSSEVLATAQSLYETHKIITYPRTSSQYLNESMRDAVISRLDLMPDKYSNMVDFARQSGCIHEKVFNDKKVEDHYGMIPTENAKYYDLSKLSKQEAIIFDAIVKRFINIFMPAHEYDATVLLTEVNGFRFKTTGKKITQIGWKSLYSSISSDDDEAQDNDNQDLTYNFTQGLTVLCEKTDRHAKKTQAPKRYTDGSLIAAMEVGGVKNTTIDDADKLEMLKEKGLGTEATRAPLIENIISKGYVERFKKTYLVPTDKGMDFISRIKVDILKSPEITGEWEHRLKLVEKGQLDKNHLIADVREFIRNCVNEAKNSYQEGDRIASANAIDAKCPICGGNVVKSPKAYFCDNNYKGCKFVIFATVCGKKLTETHVKDICSKGQTKAIKGFANPNKKDASGKPQKFDACLIYDKSAQKIKFGSADGKAPKERKETEYVCPKCGKPITEFESGYGCSGYKDGCKFSFFKNLFDKQLSKSDIDDLLHKGETAVFKNLKHPKYPSRTFNAKLVLGVDAPEIVYLNENNEVDSGKATSHFCPNCGKSILAFSNYYKCSSCGLVINKVIAGTTLSEEDIRDICTEKKTIQYLSFTSNKGKPFKARLTLNPKTKKLEFQLETKASQYKCPLCNSEVGEQDSSYRCVNSKCGLAVWKKIGSVELSDQTVSEIFTKKQTSDYLDLVSSKGNAFKAKLVVNESTKKVEFFFAPKK